MLLLTFFGISILLSSNGIICIQFYRCLMKNTIASVVCMIVNSISEVTTFRR